MANAVHTAPGFAINYDDAAIADSADLVAAVSGARIRVLAAIISMASTGTIKFQSGGSTDICSALKTTAESLVIVLPYNPMGWFQTVAGEKLNAVLSSAITTTVSLVYIKV